MKLGGGWGGRCIDWISSKGAKARAEQVVWKEYMFLTVVNTTRTFSGVIDNS